MKNPTPCAAPSSLDPGRKATVDLSALFNSMDAVAGDTTLKSGLNSPLAITFDPAAGMLYWSEFGANKIHRTKPFLSVDEELISDSQQQVHSIALDPATATMYWTDACSSLPRIRRSSMAVNPSITDIISTGLTKPQGLVVWP